ncbi:MAG: hypothetical protein ACKVQS_07120 [Fimbriimonadaceae bacterium]
MNVTDGLGINSTDAPARPTSFWRLSSRVEDHLLTSHSETVFIRALFWVLLAISTTYILTFLRRSDLTDDVVWILHLKGYLVATIMNIALFYIYYRKLNHLYLGPGLKALKHKLPNDSAVPVRLTIYQQRAITGIDEGYMWIDEGALLYKGRQTTFRLNREDIPALSLWSKKDRPNPATNRMPEIIPIPYNDRQLKIHFKVLDSHEDFATRRQAASFYNTTINWLKNPPENNFESLLPPVDLHPGFRISLPQSREPLFAGIALSVINLTIILAMNIGVNFRGTAISFAVMCTLFHLILLFFSVKLLLKARNTIRVRTQLEKNFEIL